MFKKLFGSKKVTAEAVNPVIVPTDADRLFTETQQKAFDAIVPDADGYAKIGDVTHSLLNQQSQYITRYMDGSNPSVPTLVDGLRVDVSSITHHEYRIHLDDAQEFIARVRAHRGR